MKPWEAPIDADVLARAREWVASAARREVADELVAVYADVAAQIEARGPACWASGRCCNFEKAGHLLFVTGLEAAWTVLGSPAREDRQPGGCRYQEGNLCGVHAVRPLGCRVYFCDRTAQEWQHELSEHGQKQVRAIHERFGVPYLYAEWRWLLRVLEQAR